MRLPVPPPLQPDRVEQEAGAIQVMAIALVEVGLRLPRHDSGKMKSHRADWRPAYPPPPALEISTATVRTFPLKPCGGRGAGGMASASVDPGRLVAAEPTVGDQSVGQLAADHASRAKDENMHDVLRLVHWEPGHVSCSPGFTNDYKSMCRKPPGILTLAVLFEDQRRDAPVLAVLADRNRPCGICRLLESTAGRQTVLASEEPVSSTFVIKPVISSAFRLIRQCHLDRAVPAVFFEPQCGVHR